MRKIINYFKQRADRRLRERCADYASRQKSNYRMDHLADFIYQFITSPGAQKNG